MVARSLLFGFRGRANRARYWLAMPFYLLAAVLGLVAFAIGQNVRSVSFSMNVAVLVLAAIVGLSALAIGARRLHDRNKSAWWLSLLYIVPAALVGLYVAALWLPGAPMTVPTICGLVGLVIGIWTVVELGLLRGTVGPNSYGPDPVALK